MLEGLRPCEAKTMRGQVAVSKALNRHSEETLDLDIQIEERKSEESRHPCAYGGLADAADASEEDAHVAPFDERACQFWSITSDSSRSALGLSTRAQGGCRGSPGSLRGLQSGAFSRLTRSAICDM